MSTRLGFSGVQKSVLSAQAENSRAARALAADTRLRGRQQGRWLGQSVIELLSPFPCSNNTTPMQRYAMKRSSSTQIIHLSYQCVTISS